MQVEIFTSPMYKLQNLHAQYVSLSNMHVDIYKSVRHILCICTCISSPSIFFFYLCLAKLGHITVGQNTDNYASYPSHTQYLICSQALDDRIKCTILLEVICCQFQLRQKQGSHILPIFYWEEIVFHDSKELATLTV